MYWRILFIMLMAVPCISALSWSEVHFNPQGSDNGGEFIELAGNESLDGCTVSDSASKDTLVLQQEGASGTIMIVESDNLVPIPDGVSVYSAGAAIGNGLGNTYESISIACNASAVLSMAYNTSLLDISEGDSLHYRGEWIGDTPTPGVREEDDAGNATNATSEVNETRECNTSLHLALSATHGTVGEEITLQLFSAGYASFDAAADGLPYASGDTLTSRTHPMVLPNASMLKITASARECDAKQRAVRYITIAQPPEIQEAQEAQEVVAEPQAPELQVPLQKAAEAIPLPQVTEQVILDQDADAVPWIAAFGMVTIAASTAVFLQLLRRGQA